MRPIEMQDLYSYQYLSALTAAPHGEKAALVVKRPRKDSNDYTGDIWLYENGALRQLTADGKGDSPVWEDEHHLLFPAMREEKDQKRAKEGEKFSVFYRLDIRGGEAQRAFELPIAARGLERLTDTLWFFTALIDREVPDEYLMTEEARKELIKTRKEGEDYHVLTDLGYRMNGAGFHEGTVPALFLYDAESGETERLTDPEVKVSFAQAIGGAIVYGAAAYQTTENRFNQVYRYDPATGETQTLYGNNDHAFRGAFGLGDALILLGSDCKDYGVNQNAAFYRLEKGKLTRIADPDVGFGSSVGSDCRLGGGKVFRVHGGQLYYICTVGGATQLRRMDAQGKTVVQSRKEGSLDCFDLTEKGTVLGVGLYDMALQELYRVGHGDKVEILSHFNDEALGQCYVAQPLPLSVKSHGKRIDGWVLLPRDYDKKKKYPAVLDIHGGPKTAYGPVFYHEMQLWAGRGYFVFYCNPTGSDGRGNSFADIRGKYGTVDYDDLMAFTDGVLAAYPQIDPKRVAATGGSYGGFMSNWIIGHTDRFACVATQRSISNWISFYGVSDIGPYFGRDQTAGDVFEEKDQRKMWLHSPLKYVKNAVTPTLFIHSDEDWRCPIDQGLQLYAALMEKGVDTRFVWFKGENHELSRSGKPQHRVKRLEEITAWIEKYTA